VEKFKGSGPSAPSPYGQQQPPSSLPCCLTPDQLLTIFHQRALLNQAYLECRCFSGTCRFG